MSFKITCLTVVMNKILTVVLFLFTLKSQSAIAFRVVLIICNST